MMKKITYFLLVFSLFLNGCDDGDLTIESISFDSTTAYSCSNNTQINFVYKTQGNQALILSFDEKTLQNKEGKITGEIPFNFKLTYRSFDHNPSHNYFCTIPPNSSPKITSEIQAKGGTVHITTQKVTDTNGENIKYNHLITIKDLVITNDKNEQLINSNFIFGNYQTEN